ncbi:MAG: hypothetical protein Q8R29_02620, partial [bacterium]|nr:hypothetical protein [bacterium]
EQLTELSREMRPFVEKKLESLAIQDISAIFKTLPADLDTAKIIVSLNAHDTWQNLMEDSRDKARLLQVLKREKTGPEAVNSKNFFRIDKYVYILITQAVGFLIYILIFYTDRVYPQFGESYVKYVRAYGVWHNLNWKNPLVWICTIPSALPLLIVLAFIRILGKASSWNKHDKDTGEPYLTRDSDENTTRELAQKLQQSIGRRV